MTKRIFWADHLAQFQELLGKIPKSVALSGRYSLELFNRKGELRNIRKLKFWDLKSVLSEKYKMSIQEAESLASFLQPMLDFDPEKRATAGEMLKHPWLIDPHRVVAESQAASQQRMRPEDARGDGSGHSSPLSASGARLGHLEVEASGQGSPAPSTPKPGLGLQWSSVSGSERQTQCAAPSPSGAQKAVPSGEVQQAAATGDSGTSRSPIRQMTQLLGGLNFNTSSSTSSSSTVTQAPPSPPSAADAQASGSGRRVLNPPTAST
jgi:serine/threonine protein kinase